MMKIIKSIMTKNPCYKAGKKITVKGLMLHSVGCPQPKASAFISQMNASTYDRACVHAFIDGNDGIIYQTLYWNHRAWHCGKGSKGSANDSHIGVELCEPNYVEYTSGSSFKVKDKAKAQEVVKKTYNSAVELFASLCKQYNLDPLKDIISHKEGYKKGIASNHGDPEHLWKGVGLNYTMDTFRTAVKKAMTSASTSTSKEFKVKVTTNVLNVRKGAGTNYSITCTVKDGQVYTIVDEKNGFGKLKSGAGWICLKYTKKI